ncbi:MAG: diaminopimelate decarboxylase, partial [Gemmatimonadaceae bacterium]
AVVAEENTVTADVVGPICESGDFFAKERVVDDVSAGALLAIQTTGAYGYAMASNYNSRPRPAEVLVDGERFAVITERERFEDLVRLERAHLQWRSA